MNIKFLNQIELSSATTHNVIRIFRYECPECAVKDNYLCLDPEGVTWCCNCNQAIYFQEMLLCQNGLICEKLAEIEIGQIRLKDADAQFFEKVEQQYFETLKLKFKQND